MHFRSSAFYDGHVHFSKLIIVLYIMVISSDLWILV